MGFLEAWVRGLGRRGLRLSGLFVGLFIEVGAMWLLLLDTLHQAVVAPFRSSGSLRRQLFPMLSNVGVRSFPITSLVSFLIGAILVLQTGEVLRDFGQLEQIPKMVSLSMTREMGPLMTAIIMTARVGASFTAVLASMKINEEIMALETMAIDPVRYLVVPRFLSMVVMIPCLTMYSYVIGMVGGGMIAVGKYGLTFSFYCNRTLEQLTLVELTAGLGKSVAFSVIISTICCRYGFTTEGGPTGLGRNTMVAVVTSILVVIIADALMTAAFVAFGVFGP